MSDYGQAISATVTLERRIHALQEELAKYRGNAEKWTPRVGSEVMMNEQLVNITLAFGGKNRTAQIPYSALQTGDRTSLTTAVLQAMTPLIQDQLRSVIEPEIQKLTANVTAVSKAGNW